MRWRDRQGHYSITPEKQKDLGKGDREILRGEEEKY